jgi:hypothetical protein
LYKIFDNSTLVLKTFPLTVNVQALLDDSDLVADIEMLDLVLPLVHSAVSRLQLADLRKDDDKNQAEESPKTLIIQSIRVSLEKVYQAVGLPAKQKEFAAGIGSMINVKLQL